MPNVLVKPQAERDGNLVILMDNTADLQLVDVTTGEIIEQGRNTGASNGRESTFRFSRPGGAYRNVGLMDDKGNIILTLETAGDRVQFNYSDYNALVQTPVSTIEGYRWDNSANVRAQAEGRPSNADIGSMSSEEYLAYLDQQRQEAASQDGAEQPGGGLGSLVGPAVVGLYGADALGLFDSGTSGIGPVADGAEYAAMLGEGGLPSLGTVASYAAPAAAIAYGAKTAADFLQGEDLNTAQKLGFALPTAGLSLFSDQLQDVFGLDRETTTEHQQKIADRLAAQNQEDALYQDLVQGMRESIAQGPADKPYFGKYDTWDEYKAAGLNAQDLAGQAGVLEAVGGLNLTLPQIHEVTQKLIDEDLLFSEKGAVKARDPERAREIAESIRPQDAFQAPQAPLAQARPEAEQGPLLLNSRQLVESDTDIDPPITGFEQVDGAMLPPPGAADNAALAFQLLQSAPSRSLEGQLFAGAFDEPEQRQSQLGFAQLQGAFQ